MGDITGGISEVEKRKGLLDYLNPREDLAMALSVEEEMPQVVWF